LPRGEKPNPLRERNARANSVLQERLQAVERSQLLADYNDMVTPDGVLSHQDMADYLHLTPQGYQKVFEPVHDLIQQLLNETDGLDGATGEGE